MMRTYLSKNLRLHIWDQTTQDSIYMPEASPIHDHPWHFESYVVAGQIQQCRFNIIPLGEVEHDPNKTYELLRYCTIQCGEGACVKSTPKVVISERQRSESFNAGESYYQRKDEVHETFPLTGTVTLVRRIFDGDTEHARVFWRDGDWVSAEPRPATDEEIDRVCGRALREWFK